MAHRHDVYKRGGAAGGMATGGAVGKKDGGAVEAKKGGGKVHGKKGRSKFARGGAIGSGPTHGPLWSSAHGKK